MIRILLLAALALGGCSMMTGPVDVDHAFLPAELPVSVQALPFDAVEEFTITGGDGSVVIRDRAMTGACHRTERDGAYLRDGVLTFWRAHVDPVGDVCVAIGVPATYAATVGGLAPGSYRVRVEYIGDINTDIYPRPDLEATVTVR